MNKLTVNKIMRIASFDFFFDLTCNTAPSSRHFRQTNGKIEIF